MKHQILSVAVILSALFVSCKKDKNEVIPPVTQATKTTITFENVVKPMKYVESGIFKGSDKGLIQPGADASFTFHAGKDQRLMFAMMFGKSKDWFFAAEQPGIALYDKDGKPRTGNITSDVSLWDNGTKENTSGKAESGVITSLKSTTKPHELMQLMLSYDATTSAFTLKITNTTKGKMDTAGASLETPFSPGVWVVSNVLGGKLLDDAPFFMPQKKSTTELSALAEMGNPEPLYKKVKAETGIITGLSPAVVVVYTGNKNPIFSMGQKASAALKGLSQKGDVKTLADELKKMKEVKGVYIAGSSAVAPKGKVMTTIQRGAGDKVAYALMFGYSNDWFYANSTDITATEKGDLTAKTTLYDSGTGIDQYPGAGNKQALFGGTPDKEDKAITPVDMKTFPVPATTNIIKVTLQ